MRVLPSSRSSGRIRLPGSAAGCARTGSAGGSQWLQTIKDAAPDTIFRSIKDRSYHEQDAFYIDGIQPRLAPTAPGSSSSSSRRSPYLITVRELTDQDRDIGRARNERALRIYAECEATGIWPDWTGPVTEIPDRNAGLGDPPPGRGVLAVAADNVKRIPLTKGFYALVDAEDYEAIVASGPMAGEGARKNRVCEARGAPS